MDSALLLDAMKRAKPAVGRILSRYCYDDVDDVLQKAAIRAVTTKWPWRGESKFSSWFVRVAINEALMHIRVKRPAFIELSPSLLANTQTPEQYALRNETRKKLVGAIKQLTPKRRAAALNMFLGTSDNSVQGKSRRHQARITLREALRG